MVENWDKFKDLEYHPNRVCESCGGRLKVYLGHKYKLPRFCSPICIGQHNHKVLSGISLDMWHVSGCYCCVCKNKRHEPKSEEHKRKIGLSLLGKNKKPKPPGFGAIMSKATTRSWANPKIAKQWIESWNKKPNKPEKWLNEFLQKLLPGEYQINVNAEILILARKCPDFVNIKQKKIIEFNGDYPFFFLHASRTEKEEERRRVDLFAQKGYQTLIIWEHELDDIDLLKEKVIHFHNI